MPEVTHKDGQKSIRFRVHQDPLVFQVIEDVLGEPVDPVDVPQSFKSWGDGLFVARLRLPGRDVYLDAVNALRLAAFLTHQANYHLQRVQGVNSL